MRNALLAAEEDVFAYMGYHPIEQRISLESLPQYVSAVSRYHEWHHLPSPTKTPLVRALAQTYRRDWDCTAAAQDLRISISVEDARRNLALGTGSGDASASDAMRLLCVHSCFNVDRYHYTTCPGRRWCLQ